MADEFQRARARAVEVSQQMDARVMLASAAAYWPERLTAAERDAAEDAAQLTEQDAAELATFVAWALQHHRPAMQAWAEAAAALDGSPAYARGWQEFATRWHAASKQGAAPQANLAWLITMWARARP
jgi:hypothetical protein